MNDTGVKTKVPQHVDKELKSGEKGPLNSDQRELRYIMRHKGKTWASIVMVAGEMVVDTDAAY